MQGRLAFLLVLAAIVAGCASSNNHAPSTPTTSSTPSAAGAKTCTSTKDPTKNATEPIVTLSTTQGDIRLTLYCDKTPITGQQIVKLVEAGCYDGTRFHRVVKGFMDQGGDPLTRDGSKSAQWGTGGPSDCGVSPNTIPEEYACKDGTTVDSTPQAEPQSPCSDHGGLALTNSDAGAWSMARTSAPATSGSQFFLTAAAADFLDGSYTVFGHTADSASTQVVVKINNLPCGGQPCADPPQGSSTTDTPVVVNHATIAWS
jgi:peptidylprolyl isomerase